MLSVDRQAEQIRRRDDLIHKLYQLIIALALIIIVLAMLIFFLTRSAAASSSCLTKHEARDIWPRAHIYWHGPDRCWDNHRGRHGKRYYRDKNPAMYARNQAPTKQQVFDKEPLPKSDKIIDLDDWLRNNCCWPEFARDEDGNIIETFQQRADAVPLYWWSKTYEETK